MSHQITYITCCTDIGRGDIGDGHFSFRRHFEAYKSGYRQNLDTKFPLVCYNSAPEMYIPENRNENNFVNKLFTKEILMEKLVNKDLFLQKFEDPKVYKNGIIDLLKHYGPLVCMKYHLMKEVIETNPFNSEYFAWIDCQFTAGMMDNFSSVEVCEKFSEKLVERLSSKKFLLFRHSSSGLGTLWKFNLSKYTNNIVQQNYHTSVFGFFWGAHKDTILKLNDSYWNIYTQFLNDNIIPSEELILNIMTMKSPGEFDDNFIKNENYKDLIYKNVLNTSIK